MLDEVQAASEVFARAVSTLRIGELRAPSLLPGWSRGHVIAHVALNAEGFVAVARALRAGEPAFMYPGGVLERDQAIDQLANASAEELRHRLRVADETFRHAWNPPPPTGDGATAAGHPTFSSSTVLQRRLRELQVHLVDLGLDAFGVDAWSASFVDADLRLQWPTVEHRTREAILAIDEFGVVWRAGRLPDRGEPTPIARRRLLAWVLDRAHVDGLPTLQPWSNRSRWEHLPPPR